MAARGTSSGGGRSSTTHDILTGAPLDRGSTGARHPPRAGGGVRGKADVTAKIGGRGGSRSARVEQKEVTGKIGVRVSRGGTSSAPRGRREVTSKIGATPGGTRPTRGRGDSTVGRRGSGAARARARGRGNPQPKSERPSAAIDRRVNKKNPFASTARSKSNFVREYDNGGIPCRLSHGSVNHTLVWDVPPEELAYDPLLVTIAEGLADTTHPHIFVSRRAWRDLLECEDAYEKTLPLVRRLAMPLKSAMSSDDTGIFIAALEAVTALSNCVGSELDQCLSILLVPVNKKASKKATRDACFDCLLTLQENGGPDAAKIIKKRVPTFTPV